MRPSDALAFKRIMLEDARRYAVEREREPEPPGLGEFGDVTQTLISILPHCRTYFVTADMAAVAKRAGETLPPGTDLRNAPPSPEGFMYFDAPLFKGIEADDEDSEPEHEINVNAVTWWTSRVIWGDPRRVGDDDFMPDLTPAPKGTRVLFCLEMELGRDGIREGRYHNVTMHPLREGLPDGAEDAPLWAAWILMQQSLVVSESAIPDRPERRRCMGSDVQPQYVIVRLRRLERPTAPGPDSPVEWSHRWLVSGHWRQQYYPSKGGNSPIWISPYVKGPEGKPLVVKDRVTAWVR